jgi:hypothetical protein
MELKPCSECGIRVTDVDIRQGDGASVGGRFYCRKCAKALDVKSDYTAVGPGHGSHSLSDTQFFRRAGKMFEELDASAPRRKGRKKREISRPRPRTNPAQPKKGISKRDKNKYALWIGVMVAVILLLVLIIVAVAVK